MNVENLRKIGRELFFEIGETRLKPFASESIGKGAAGDKTFPIDRQAEEIIVGSLESLDEPMTIVSEEMGIKESAREGMTGNGAIAVIDPIDGSKNAVSGVPFYCSSIAIAEDTTVGGVSLAYVINLLSGDEFWAERGKGAFFNGEPVHAQESDIFNLIAYETPNPKLDLPRILPLLAEARRTRCLGATALDLSYLAYGSISIFAMPSPSRPFDFAAGYLLVREAGGVCTDMDGNSLDGVSLGVERSVPLLAAGNRALHERALTLLHG